jgi:hypothetical protein
MPNPHRAGVGLRLSPQPNGEYEVVYTQEGGPAFASGEILPGDVLLTVDGTPISHATLGARLRPALCSVAVRAERPSLMHGIGGGRVCGGEDDRGDRVGDLALLALGCGPECYRAVGRTARPPGLTSAGACSGKSGMIRVVRLRRALANELPGQLRAFHPDGGKFFHDPSYSPLVPPGSFVRTHVPSPTRRQSRSPPPSTSPTWPRTSPRARPLSLSAGSDHVPPHPRALRGSPPPASPPKTSPGARRFWQQSALPSNGSYVVPGSEPWPGPQGSNKDARVVGVI